MSDESWDEQFKRFLRKTGEDVRRAGADVTAEAQKLLDAAMDPERQQKVRDRLSELGVWARKTAQGVAGAVEEAASKAETAFHRATEKKPRAAPAAERRPPAKKTARAKAARPAKKGGTKRKR